MPAANSSAAKLARAVALPPQTRLADAITSAVARAEAEASRPKTLLALAYADPERLVGTEEASLITGLGVPTLCVYRCTGRLRARSAKGQRVRYRIGDLLAYVEKNKRAAS